jgi:excisionase family DNA binding protein
MESDKALLNFEELPRKSLLRPQEVADFLNVSLRTVYRWYEMGMLEGTRLKGSMRIFRESVIKLVGDPQNE